MNQESPVRPSAVLTRSPGDPAKLSAEMSRQSGDLARVATIATVEEQYLASLEKRFKTVEVVIVKALLRAESSSLPVVSVLLDSGALHGSRMNMLRAIMQLFDLLLLQ
jgi:hypothetical protein